MKKLLSFLLSATLLVSLSISATAEEIINPNDIPSSEEYSEIEPRYGCGVCGRFVRELCLADLTYDGQNTHKFGECTRTYYTASSVQYCDSCGNTQELMTGHLCKIYHSGSSCGGYQDTCYVG